MWGVTSAAIVPMPFDCDHTLGFHRVHLSLYVPFKTSFLGAVRDTQGRTARRERSEPICKMRLYCFSACILSGFVFFICWVLIIDSCMAPGAGGIPQLENLMHSVIKELQGLD